MRYKPMFKLTICIYVTEVSFKKLFKHFNEWSWHSIQETHILYLMIEITYVHEVKDTWIFLSTSNYP